MVLEHEVARPRVALQQHRAFHRARHVVQQPAPAEGAEHRAGIHRQPGEARVVDGAQFQQRMLFRRCGHLELRQVQRPHIEAMHRGHDLHEVQHHVVLLRARGLVQVGAPGLEGLYRHTVLGAPRVQLLRRNVAVGGQMADQRRFASEVARVGPARGELAVDAQEHRLHRSVAALDVGTPRLAAHHHALECCHSSAQFLLYPRHGGGGECRLLCCHGCASPLSFLCRGSGFSRTSERLGPAWRGKHHPPRSGRPCQARNARSGSLELSSGLKVRALGDFLLRIRGLRFY